MKSDLFAQANLEVEGVKRFALQNPQLLRVALGPDVLSVKGAMVAYQGQVRFDHEKAGSMGKLLKKGPGFVVVQPSESAQITQGQNTGGGGGIVGNLLGN